MAVKPALIGACVGAVVAGGLSWMWSRITTSSQLADEEENEDRVIFFPPLGPPPCQSVLTGGACRRRNCGHSHSADHPLAVLLMALRTTETSLDVAIYTFSFSFLKEEVLAALRRGARVRVLVDREQVAAGGCAVSELLKAGIQVRQGPSDFYLHHKFAIVDGKMLVNGSLNWSRAAVMGNHENVVITKQPHFVASFQEEFNRMWSMYDPRKS